MKKVGGVHTFEDKPFLSWVSRMSFIVAVAGLVVGVVWFCAAELLGVGVLDAELERALSGGGLDGISVWFVYLIAGAVVSFLVHEAVHALFFKLFAPPEAHVTFGANWKMGMLYACAEGIIYTRRQYESIVLAPTVLVTAAVVGIGAAWAHPLWAIMVATLHLSGCTGDWGYVRAIHRARRVAWCEDTTWGVQFYGDAPEGL